MSESIRKKIELLVKDHASVGASYGEKDLAKGLGKFSNKNREYRRARNKITLDQAHIYRFGNFRFAGQSGQDFFVQQLESDLKTYLEVGACFPIQVSNTYILEQDCGFAGISVELEPKLVEEFNLVRRNHCYLGDGTKFDYKEVLKNSGFPADIGYLSLDIDPAWQSLACLLKIPFDEYRFAVITFEHDEYRVGSEIKNLSRSFFEYYGYELVVGDVLYQGRYSYEDWWVHPKLIDTKRYEKFIANCVSGEAILVMQT
jgi:hypothetical protein